MPLWVSWYLTLVERVIFPALLSTMREAGACSSTSSSVVTESQLVSGIDSQMGFRFRFHASSLICVMLFKAFRL